MNARPCLAFTVAATLALWCGLPSAVRAADDNAEMERGARSSSSSSPYFIAAPYARDYGLASGQLAAARERERARSLDLVATTERLRKSFAQSAEVMAAENALKDAQTAHDAARARALSRLDKDEDYQFLVQRHRRVCEMFEQRKREPAEQRVALAKLKLEAANDLRQREALTFLGDADVQWARKAVLDAGQRVASLRSAFEESLQTSPQMVNARAAWERSREEVRVAGIFYAGAAAAYDQALYDQDFIYDLQYQRYRHGNGYVYSPFGYGSGYNWGYPTYWNVGVVRR